MTILFDSARTVNLAPRTFGRGIPSERRRTFAPSLEDLSWAARFFGELEDNRHLDELAEQARWDDRFNGTIPAAGRCLNCGQASDDLTFQGLCDRCDDVATNATTAGQDARAGLG